MSAAVTTTDSTSTGEPGHFDFAAYLESSRQQVEQALDGSLGPERPESLREAMRYSLLAGVSACGPSFAWRPASWPAVMRPWRCRRLWLWK